MTARLPPPGYSRLEIGPGAGDFEVMRSLLQEDYRWELAVGDRARDFRASALILHAGPQTYGTTRMSGSRIFRDKAVLARSHADAILVQIYLGTGYRATAGGRTTEIHPGDVALFDLARPLTIDASAIANLSLTLSRATLAPLVRSLDGVHGRVLARRSRRARLISHHIRTVLSPAEPTDRGYMARVTDSSAGLVAACLGPSEAGLPAARSAARLALAGLVREEIDRRVGDPAFDVAAIQATFNLSRSALYRLFEESGGVERAITERRLDAVRRLLLDPAAATPSIAELARRAGYASQSSFTRAFSRAFGATPRDLRRSALTGAAGTRAEPGGA